MKTKNPQQKFRVGDYVHLDGKPGKYQIHEIQFVRLHYWYGLKGLECYLIHEKKLSLWKGSGEEEKKLAIDDRGIILGKAPGIAYRKKGDPDI